MRIPRIYTGNPLQPGSITELESQAALHVTRVLRLKPGAEVIAFNGEGGEYSARLHQVEKSRAWIDILEFRNRDIESPLNICLIQGISRGERMDYTIQKAVELGVQKIVPVSTERSVVQLNPERREKRHRHWQGVIISACEQCGRTKLPQLEYALDFRDFLGSYHGTALKLTLQPDAALGLSGVQWQQQGIDLLVGPEGGLSEQELALAAQLGFCGIRLGPRILRTETAAVAVLGAIQMLWGDFA